MAKKRAKQSAAGRSGASKKPGWLLIFALAAGILLFLVLGTMDASLRYDLIGL